MGVTRAHDAHMQHVRKGHVRGEPAAAAHQGLVLEARNGTADEAHGVL